MKRRWPLALGCLVAAGLIAGGVACAASGEGGGGGAKAASVTVTCDEFMQTPSPVSIARDVGVKRGGTVTLTLCSNQTTGFEWGAVTIGEESVLKLTGDEFRAGASGMLGAAGEHVWTFSAMAKGETIAKIAYSQPWPGGTKDAWQFALTVRVE